MISQIIEVGRVDGVLAVTEPAVVSCFHVRIELSDQPSPAVPEPPFGVVADEFSIDGLE